jgi:hypothetical protein
VRRGNRRVRRARLGGGPRLRNSFQSLR